MAHASRSNRGDGSIYCEAGRAGFIRLSRQLLMRYNDDPGPWQIARLLQMKEKHMPRRISRSRLRTGFSLVELLVVMGIIAILISLLVPALAKARDMANVTRCSNNLAQVGVTFRVFSQDHDGRLPYTQCCPWGCPWWDNCMYSHDYFELVDRYGLNKKLLLCPGSMTAESDSDPVYYQFGNWTEAQARQATATVTGDTELGPANDRDNPSFEWQVAASGGLYNYHVDFNCYAYMGFNNQYDNRSPLPASATIGSSDFPAKRTQARR